MSNDTKAHIHCDGCGAEIVEATKVGAEQVAYVRGWHRLSDGRDICPQCKSAFWATGRKRSPRKPKPV